MLKKILIANRGEIAVRIIRTCREMDIPTVAIYSTADRTAPHVLMADEAVEIGPPPATQSYLRGEAIVDIAVRSGCDGVHPGYGFLSENADFADQVTAAGMTWIGPPAKVMAQMGDKLAARKLALRTGTPVLEGLDEAVADFDAALDAADQIGYPVLVKAAGGGGGKGMRIVRQRDELVKAIELARSEAGNAFADDRVFLQKYLHGPHHIEVQIFADQHGNIVSLGERECSIQRRYQKIVEETPSPFINDALRVQLAQSAENIARECGYVGAGTVEFLVDEERNFYFLEMNTRLQVEHPITELVTGYDLVAAQLQVAAGEPLPFRHDDVVPRGHAIECRIYAEDGFDGFAPSIGTIVELSEPGGPGVRLDHGIRAGLEITPHYDPLLGKLCSWGRTRQEAINRMGRALEELRIVGLHTTIPFCRAVMHSESFTSGRYNTHFITDHQAELEQFSSTREDHLPQVAALGAALFADREKPRRINRPDGDGGDSAWLAEGRRRQMRR